MDEKELKKMLDCAVHFGHRAEKWNPKMKPYIHGRRKGIHIFDLEKTYECLLGALEFVKKLVSEGKSILFVGTKPQALHFIVKAAKDCGMPFVVHKWIPGLLTNFGTIKKRIDYLRKLKDQDGAGEFDKYTKKEALDLRCQIQKLEAALGGVQNITDVPDALFVIDAVRDNIAIREANCLKIPVLAIADSVANPSQIDYVIPGNDDAIKSLEFFIAKISEAVSEAKSGKTKQTDKKTKK